MEDDNEASGGMWHEMKSKRQIKLDARVEGRVEGRVEARMEARMEAKMEARITEFSKALFDLNEAVSSNINYNDRRTLENGGLIKKMAQTLEPMKLELSTLLDVFRAFFDVMPPRYLSQDAEFAKKKVYFDYDSKMWCGTVSCENSPYGKPNQFVQFTNIKLPNDGFLYMEKYCKGGKKGKKTLLIEETDESDLVVGTIVSSVCTQWPIDFDNVEVNYRFDEGRFEIYCWNGDRSRCVTVKFEYGKFVGFKQQGKYDGDRLRKFLVQTESK